MTLIRLLVEKRQRRWSAGYIGAALLLFLLGAIGSPYGAHYLFWPLAALALSVTLVPTLLAWGLILAVFTGGAVAYLTATILDLISGSRSRIFSDGPVGVMLVLLVVGLLACIIYSKPKRMDCEDSINKPLGTSQDASRDRRERP